MLKNHFSFGEWFWDTSNSLIFWVLFPSLLFTSMSRAELDQLPTGGMAFAVIPAILTVAFLTLIVQKTYPMDTRGFTSVFQGSIRLNTYLGLAIAGGVMGAKGLEYAAYTAAVMITLVNFLSVVTVERFVGMKSGWWSLLKSVLANPLILACVLGMVFSIFHLRLLEVAYQSLVFLGGASLPMGLLTVGAGLRFSSVKHSLGPIMWCSFLKLILLPAISGLVCWRFGLQNEATMIVVVFSSLPASASAYVMAHQMGGDAELMASILAIQTLFSVFLLSGILVYFTPL